MAQQKTANRNRFDFSKIPATIQIPNLIEVQKRSYDRFLQMDALPSERDDAGLQAVFQSVFPITDFRNVSQLDFVEYAIGNWECKCGHLKGLNHLRTTCRNCGATVKTDPFHLGDVLCTKCGTYNANTPDFCNKCGDPVGLQLKYDVAECEERGMTYSAPLKVTMRLTIYDKDPETGNRSIRDMKEQEVFFGDIPLMTTNGTFIINGTERVIVSQLHRSPGVFFETANNRTYFLGKIIPYRGSWVEFEYDQKNILYVRIDRKRKFLGSIFLRALGLRSDEDILRTFYTVDRLALRDNKIYWTLEPGVDQPDEPAGHEAGASHRHQERRRDRALRPQGYGGGDEGDPQAQDLRNRSRPERSGRRIRCGRRRRHHHRRSAARSQLRADRRQAVEDARRQRRRSARVLPRARRCGHGHQRHAAPRFGQDAAGSADRDLPQAASGRSADARHRDLALPRHVLRFPEVRLLARGPLEVQHQAVREGRRHQSRKPHARAGRLLRNHPLPAQAAQEHRLGGRHRSPWQPPRTRGRRAAGEPVPYRTGPHGTRHQGKDERVPGDVDGHAARPGQRQAGHGCHPRVLRIVAVVAVHGPDQPAVGDHAQAPSVGTGAGRSVA